MSTKAGETRLPIAGPDGPARRAKFLKYCKQMGLKPVYLVDDTSPAVGFCWKRLKSLSQEVKRDVQCLRSHIVGIVDDHRFNARATTTSDGDFIILNSAVPIMLMNLFLALLSDDKVFGANWLPASHKTKPIKLDSSKLHEGLYNFGMLFETDMTSERYQLALGLFETCLRFLYIHETVHLRNGHIAMRAQAGNASPMLLIEEESNSEVGLSNLDYQTLEWDADKVALLVSCGHSARVIIGWLGMTGNGREETAGKLFSLALHLMFRVMDTMELKKPSRHPSAVVRSSYLMIHSEEVFRASNITLNKPESVLNICAAELVWRQFLGDETVGTEIIADELKASEDQIVSILLNWNTLRKRLAPFNRGSFPLASPVISD